eukprot:1585089-Prymnesium_polylepis.5
MHGYVRGRCGAGVLHASWRGGAAPPGGGNGRAERGLRRRLRVQRLHAFVYKVGCVSVAL